MSFFGHFATATGHTFGRISKGVSLEVRMMKLEIRPT